MRIIYIYIITGVNKEQFITGLSAGESDSQRRLTNLTQTGLVTSYFTLLLRYTQSTKQIVDEIAIDIGEIVKRELRRNARQQVLPTTLMVFLSLFVPVIVYITFKATLSMFRYVSDTSIFEYIL
mgnify:CR=1 FL=1